MPDDLFDEFLGYDFAMGADMVKCPHCDADFLMSAWDKRGAKFKKDDVNA